MTISYGKDRDVEQELTARLTELARAFIADLTAQGRLVDTGGAETLRRLQEQHRTQTASPDAEPGDLEVIETAAHPAPGAPLRWETIIAPRAGEDTPGLPQAPRPLHIIDASEPFPASASVTDSCDVLAGTPDPANLASAQQPAVLAPLTAHSTGVQESRAAEGEQAQSAAAVTAARLRAENAGRLEAMQITSDHERVSVHIHALSLDDWEYWLGAIGAPLNAPTQRSGWAQQATGHLDGVEVHLTADAVPRLLEEAAHQATEPFCLGGRIYDLALDHTDRLGQTWHYHGRHPEDDTPLLTLGGTSGPPYPLTSIVMANGPLTPATTDTPKTG